MAGLNHQACGELDPRIGHASWGRSVGLIRLTHRARKWLKLQAKSDLWRTGVKIRNSNILNVLIEQVEGGEKCIRWLRSVPRASIHREQIGLCAFLTFAAERNR